MALDDAPCKEKLEQTERELIANLMKLYQQNRLIQKSIEELKWLKKAINNPGQNAKQINEKLQSLINELDLFSGNQMWYEFEKSFLEANQYFIEKISKTYPSLTPNETKLCIFLGMNMRTKDISAITHQSIKSINVARTRLRKKLKINNSATNLHTFLKQID
jgi:DNA-binding CsgD family transcriptional regulator